MDPSNCQTCAQVYCEFRILVCGPLYFKPTTEISAGPCVAVHKQHGNLWAQRVIARCSYLLDLQKTFLGFLGDVLCLQKE